MLKFAAVAGLATARQRQRSASPRCSKRKWRHGPISTSIWLTWWLGDLAGALVVTPLIVLWVRYRRDELAGSALTGALAGLAGAVVVGAIAFSPLVGQSLFRAPLAFLAIVPLVWTALRVGPRDTATVAFVLSAFAVWGTLIDGGPFARATVNDSFLMLVMFMITSSVPSLALSADAAMRRRTESDLRKMQVALDDTIQARTEALASTNAQLAHSNAQLYDSNVLLREAQRLADIGSFIWDIPANRLTWSDQLFTIYGQKREEFGGTPADFFKHVHPDDRETVRKNNEKILASGTSFRGEERIVRPNGDVRHLQTIGEVVRDDNGAPLRVIGVCRDVTDSRRIESALARVGAELPPAGARRARLRDLHARYARPRAQLERRRRAHQAIYGR